MLRPCIAFAAVCLLVAGRAPARDLYVATNGAGGLATNWTSAYSNLQSAFDAAAP